MITAWIKEFASNFFQGVQVITVTSYSNIYHKIKAEGFVRTSKPALSMTFHFSGWTFATESGTSRSKINLLA